MLPLERNSIYNVGNDNWVFIDICQYDNLYEPVITINQHGDTAVDGNLKTQLIDMEHIRCDNMSDMKLFFNDFFNKREDMQLEQQIIQATNNLSPEAVNLITTAIHDNTVMIRWVFGICAGGFMTMAGWLFNMTGQVNQAKRLVQSITDIKESVRKIEVAMIGDYQHAGLITKHKDLEHDVHLIKEKLVDK
jgi:hypothetical protein